MAENEKLEVRMDEMEAEARSLRQQILREAQLNDAYRQNSKLIQYGNMALGVVLLGGMLIMNSRQSKKMTDANRKINELQERVNQ